MAFSPTTIAAANDKVPDEAVSHLRDRASQLGIPADTAEMLIAKIKHGEPLDSERNIPPVEVRQSTTKGYLLTQYVYPDGSINFTSIPHHTEKGLIPHPGNDNISPYSIANCQYKTSGFARTWSGCIASGGNIYITMYFRFDAYHERGQSAKITRYWDEKVESYLGAIGPLGFTRMSPQSVYYKTAWTSAAGAPSKIYTLAVQISSAGELSSKFY